MRHIAGFALCACLATTVAQAQSVTTIQTVLEPTILAPGGEIKGCGIRVAGVSGVLGNSDAMELVDASINVYIDGFALVKAGLHGSSVSRAKEKPQPTGGHIEWLRIGNGKPLDTKGAKMQPADDPGYDIYGVAFEDGYQALLGFLDSKTLWVGFKTRNGISRVFSGPTKMTPDVAKQLLSCLQEMAKPVPRK